MLAVTTMSDLCRDPFIHVVTVDHNLARKCTLRILVSGIFISAVEVTRAQHANAPTCQHSQTCPRGDSPFYYRDHDHHPRLLLTGAPS